MPEAGDWRDRILKEFTPKVARVTLAADPDGLLLEEALVEAIRGRGFELLPLEDPIAFRFAYESRFRGRNDAADLVVVSRTDSDGLAAVPYDLLGARQLSFGLGELFSPILAIRSSRRSTEAISTRSIARRCDIDPAGWETMRRRISSCCMSFRSRLRKSKIRRSCCMSCCAGTTGAGSCRACWTTVCWRCSGTAGLLTHGRWRPSSRTGTPSSPSCRSAGPCSSTASCGPTSPTCWT